uniref:Putative ATPase, AAA-type, core n=1 Tax=Helianthus annuus TaxID=4232 RepID=A0A251SGM3_HELAN
MSSSTESKMAMAKTVVSSIGSVVAASMVVRSVARDYLPSEFQDYLYYGFRNFINKFFRQLTVVIYEFDGIQENDIYNAATLYLGSRISTKTHRIKINKNTSEENINIAMEIKDEFVDIFNGVKFKWSLVCKEQPTIKYHNYNNGGSTSRSDQRSLELTFHRKHKDLALNEYLSFILNDAKTRKREDKTVKIFTTQYETEWTSVNLDHPAKFATLAMDIDVKERVMKDLDRFVERREYYRKVGKAWKRGYLLSGPPGTGKSSLVAAMANYLNFDIYDLELTDIRSNSDLRRLLVTTANRSIVVVEDIDCSAELHDREDAKEVVRENDQYQEYRVTLSGFLNFIDGLWSSCGDERIIIFTTNRKDKLDPALLRPGRMDVHINMSYCTQSGFRLLASNYLGITQHSLFEQIEDLIGEAEVTPAEAIPIYHPATFATLAMDTDVKEKVMKDLDRFVERREYYRKVGKAWKRGYLLYGPPGTGKSSLVAAMANYLNFDIYDLELTDIRSNAELRRLLVTTANRSILVVEDIDCSAELHDREEVVRDNGKQEEYRVTLSGFLNFIDGLWSSCGDERIIVFTTNRKEKLDPALLRAGRMDVHINMSYCTPSGFRLLASNYLGITQHDLFEEIEDLIGEAEVTPAEVAEQLLQEDDPDIALGGLIEFFDVKRKQNEETKAKAKDLAAKEIEKSEIVRESV